MSFDLGRGRFRYTPEQVAAHEVARAELHRLMAAESHAWGLCICGRRQGAHATIEVADRDGRRTHTEHHAGEAPADEHGPRCPRFTHDYAAIDAARYAWQAAKFPDLICQRCGDRGDHDCEPFPYRQPQELTGHEKAHAGISEHWPD